MKTLLRSFPRPRVAVCAFMLAAGLGVLSGTPGIHRGLTLPPTRLVAPRQRPRILDRRGNLYTHFGSEQIDVKYGDVPKHVVNAFLAREDAKFFIHDGVSWAGLARASVANIKHRGVKQGASTITMQLVEHSYQLPQNGGWNRWQSKWTEWIIAMRSESALTSELGKKELAKQRILECYLNRVSFGHGVVGLGSASRYYFQKSVKELTLGEGAMLAGLLRGPTANSPYLHPDTARAARDAVLSRMIKEGWASDSDAKRAKFLVVPNPTAPRPKHNGYLPAAIKREIGQLIEAGKLPKDMWKHEDIEIGSTLDLWAQQVLDSEIRETCSRIDGTGRRSEKERLAGAGLLMDNATGEIRALVAGQDFDKNQYDLALMAERQLASTVKPFVFGAYIEAGGRMTDQFSNSPLSADERKELKGWNPDNSSSLSVGRYSISTGLAHSDNYVTVRAGRHAGMSNVRNTFVASGLISSKSKAMEPSSLLGASESTLGEIVSSFSAFPRGGTRVTPHLVKTVKVSGTTIYTAAPTSSPVFSTTTCFAIHKGLREAMVSGTGARAMRENAPRIPVAGKTGTSQRSVDAWWVGYVEEFTLGVRFGRDSNRPIATGASGGNVAAPTATAVLSRLSRHYPMKEACSLPSYRLSAAAR